MTDSLVHMLAGEEAYVKDVNSKWWDGYNGYSDVIIGDFGGEEASKISAYEIKQISDWVPYRVRVKRGPVIGFNARNVYITSKKDPLKGGELNIAHWGKRFEGVVDSIRNFRLISSGKIEVVTEVRDPISGGEICGICTVRYNLDEFLEMIRQKEDPTLKGEWKDVKGNQIDRPKVIDTWKGGLLGG